MSLFNRQNSSFRISSGFTLIELLVVISIIGMLSSIVIVSLQNARAKAVNAAIKQTLGQFKNAAALYQSEHSSNYYVSATDNICTNQTSGSNPYSFFYESAKTKSGGASLNVDGPWNDYGVALQSTDGIISQCQVNNLQKYVVVTDLAVPEGSNRYWCVDSLGNSLPVNNPQYGDGLDDVVNDSTTLCADANYF